MNFLDDFRDARAGQALTAEISALASVLALPARIMEVCGSHTMAIARSGIRSVLPANVELISGPGCPVCVTEPGYIDAACTLAEQGRVVATFGDMMKVPGSSMTLSECRANGAAVHVCYSPLDALRLAEEDSVREVVFLAIGFETTIAPILAALDAAETKQLHNFSLLTAFKVIPPAMRILASDPEVKINGFLCPAHVSAIIGANAYAPVASEFSLPCVIAGFEPLDILLGLKGIVEQLVSGRSVVENQYSRVVKPEGNKRAQLLMSRYLQAADARWRGLGVLPASGLVLRPAFAARDAEQRFGLTIQPGKASTACRCGDVLKGIIRPPECVLFGRGCTPQHPIGPCMVSSEGSCAACYKYSGSES